MSLPAIEVTNVSKEYILGANSADTFRDQITDFARNLIRRSTQKVSKERLWALKDINLTVEKGEVLGIIGHNGAGKSTLLKVLSRITHPTHGEIIMRGRVSSLLEVGTGFHPELTGRENIYMNAAILGMKRAETRAKFDEIVDFAEVERFIDTPVKRYSSGMYMRLAFAVAAHLDPEILIVDEVLAVGDVAFQKKSLGKMNDVANEGRTVLLVSHNIGAISSLCTRAILLDHGEIIKTGDPHEVIENYVNTSKSGNGEIVFQAGEARGKYMELCAARTKSDGKITTDVDIAKDITIEIDYRVLKPDIRANVGIHIYSNMGVAVLASVNFPSAIEGIDNWSTQLLSEGVYRTSCKLPANFLNDTVYRINVQLLVDFSRLDVAQENILSIVCHDSGEMRKEYVGGWLGVVRPKLPWDTEKIE